VLLSLQDTRIYFTVVSLTTGTDALSLGTDILTTLDTYALISATDVLTLGAAALTSAIL
jgi:hypothetical protein